MSVPTLDPSTSRMTIVVRGDDTRAEQVTKQLNKLVDVSRSTTSRTMKWSSASS
jgi:acetolactate synthase-1/3 small subunit